MRECKIPTQGQDIEEYGAIYLMGSRKDVEQLYQAMDVFVLPSRYEGLPVVAVEAQAAGLPCVLSDQITDEIVLSDLTVFENINKRASIWAEKVIRESCYAREATVSENLKEKFDISQQSNMLTNYYLNLFEAD